MPSTPLNTCVPETWARAPSKATLEVDLQGNSKRPSPVPLLQPMEERESNSMNGETADGCVDDTKQTRESNEINQETDEERRQREEDESIALARALMAEEAMAVSYHMSMDYLEHNRDQFSEEDLAALQAAMEDDEPEQAEGLEEDADGQLSYEQMLRLGERLGDVKSERWSRVAREKINELRTSIYDPATVKGEDNNDCAAKCLVCQCEYETGDCLRQLPCRHFFHRDCVDQWLLSKDCCPYCRVPIVPDDK